MTKPLIIVSGLPRSGTSMLMKMLEAGGVEIFQDGIRQPDTDNPKGYYEYEKVKDLATDASWLSEACGKAIKIISSLLSYVPADLESKIIFMRRDMAEILASQKKMLERSGQPEPDISDEVMAAKFSIHLRKIMKYLAAQPQQSVLSINYSEVISSPLNEAKKIRTFIGAEMDVEKMARVVDKDLYRQRA